MEKTPKITEKSQEQEPSIDLKILRAEITELKAKMPKHYELSRINLKDLTEKDAQMWKKYKDKSMTPEEISYGSVYHNDVEKDIKKPNYGSRENLRAFFRQNSPQLIEQQVKHENTINGNSNK
jgi:hypothetical protein